MLEPPAENLHQPGVDKLVPEGNLLADHATDELVVAAGIHIKGRAQFHHIQNELVLQDAADEGTVVWQLVEDLDEDVGRYLRQIQVQPFLPKCQSEGVDDPRLQPQTEVFSECSHAHGELFEQFPPSGAGVLDELHCDAIDPGVALLGSVQFVFELLDFHPEGLLEQEGPLLCQ